MHLITYSIPKEVIQCQPRDVDVELFIERYVYHEVPLKYNIVSWDSAYNVLKDTYEIYVYVLEKEHALFHAGRGDCVGADYDFPAADEA